MIDAIKKLLDRYVAGVGEDAPADRRDAVHLAVAALLVQLTGVDTGVQENEREAVRAAVRAKLNLDEESAKALLSRAEEAAQEATSDWQFTSVIKQAYGPEERVRLIEQLWRVAFADHELDAHEEHLIRRIADLLYVPHRDFIATKLRVQEEAQDDH
jgi:uncharacterized tellurite resistance protein B-like protein